MQVCCNSEGRTWRGGAEGDTWDWRGKKWQQTGEGCKVKGFVGGRPGLD